jgi:hypothetical protein
MTQTLYAHMNKRNLKRKRNKLSNHKMTCKKLKYILLSERTQLEKEI